MPLVLMPHRGLRLHELRELASFWGSVTRTGGVYIDWRLGYVKRGGLRCVGLRLREPRQLASVGGPVMRTGGVCIVWWLGYTKRGCLRCLGAGLHEPRLLASFGGWFRRDRMAGIVWALGYAKRSCLLRFRGWLCETILLASFGCMCCCWLFQAELWEQCVRAERVCNSLCDAPCGSPYSRVSPWFLSPLASHLHWSKVCPCPSIKGVA